MFADAIFIDAIRMVHLFEVHVRLSALKFPNSMSGTGSCYRIPVNYLLSTVLGEYRKTRNTAICTYDAGAIPFAWIVLATASKIPSLDLTLLLPVDG